MEVACCGESLFHEVVIEVGECRRKNGVLAVHGAIESPLHSDDFFRGEFFPAAYMEMVGKNLPNEGAGVVVDGIPQLPQILFGPRAGVSGLLLFPDNNLASFDDHPLGIPDEIAAER